MLCFLFSQGLFVKPPPLNETPGPYLLKKTITFFIPDDLVFPFVCFLEIADNNELYDNFPKTELTSPSYYSFRKVSTLTF
jgi:hypothetical protein